MYQESKRACSPVLRFGELFFAEEREVPNADAELEQQTHPEPRLRESTRPSTSKIRKGRAGSRAVEAVCSSDLDDG